jgi:hypothetical protein
VHYYIPTKAGGHVARIITVHSTEHIAVHLLARDFSAFIDYMTTAVVGI